MNMKLPRTALAAALASLLAGCMVGPDYHRPQVQMPAQFKPLPGWSAAAPGDADIPKGNWWAPFHDPLLDELEPQVAVSNQTVAQDYANYQAAMAEVKEARSALFPTIGISGAGDKQHTNSSSGFAGSRPISTSGSLEGTASWAPDLWGKVRRGIEQSKATAQASQATLANATLSEQAALASAVIELRATDASIDLQQQAVTAYQDYLRVTHNQVAAGTAPPSDEISARTQLENAQSSLMSLGIARAQYAHAIAVLVGKNPEDLDIPHDASLPSLPVVPSGVPSTLLQRRPDIAVAERQMAAQNAAIGIAEAAYYPTLSLSGADGFSQSPLAGLLHIANHVWSLGADIGATLFDGGERSGEVAAAKANYEAAVANYRGTVLGALQNVEDDLSNLSILARQSDVQDAAARDATRGAEIALNEYQAGTVDYTTVATAQATEFSSRQSALGVHEQRLLDTVSLIGDLGGGWSADELGKAPQAGVGR
jgi:NodT family efflux transporter outer membrane factor (OMF) lipoprotein